jgi:hypothetical protein
VCKTGSSIYGVDDEIFTGAGTHTGDILFADYWYAWKSNTESRDEKVVGKIISSCLELRTTPFAFSLAGRKTLKQHGAAIAQYFLYALCIWEYGGCFRQTGKPYVSMRSCNKFIVVNIRVQHVWSA